MAIVSDLYGKVCNNLKTVFLLLTVWLTGLFVGSYFNVTSNFWLNDDIRETQNIGAYVINVTPRIRQFKEIIDPRNNTAFLPNFSTFPSTSTTPPPTTAAAATTTTTPNTTASTTTITTTSTTTAAAAASTTTTTTTTTTHTPSTEAGTNASCQFPSLNPFDPTIKGYIKKHRPMHCNGIPSVVIFTDDRLEIDYKQVRDKIHTKKAIDCLYKRIVRNPSNDFSIKLGSWSKTFNSSIRLQDDDDNVYIECFRGKELVAKQYLALIRPKKEVEEKRKKDYAEHVKKNSPKETLSLLFIGLEGTSRQNLIRSMPKTRKYVLETMKGIEFEKFNKIGLNTFPNVFGLLTGLHSEEVDKKTWTDKETFDKIDYMMIWNKFQKAGYRTALTIDSVYITAFHYLKHGWTKPPFDFYGRPISIASEKDSADHYRTQGANCMGDKPEIAAHYDYWLQLTSKFNNTKETPYFAYSFMNRLIHDDQNMASAADEFILKFFQTLVNGNVLNNTLVVFFSDHGERFGYIRYTYNGLIEAKNPFLFLIFPPWFEKKYPEVTRVMKVNTQRLMTMFDLHATLEELVNFQGTSKKVSPVQRGISLFSEIPANRTCSVAGIPTEFCACNTISRKGLESPKLVETLVSQFVQNIVSRTNGLRSKCVTLKLKKNISVFSVQSEVALDKGEYLYQITVQTTPGDAVYQGTVSYRPAKKDFRVAGAIARLNMYRGQAECIDKAELRSFCYCSNLSKKHKKKPQPA